jgi:hypothetical protein
MVGLELKIFIGGAFRAGWAAWTRMRGGGGASDALGWACEWSGIPSANVRGSCCLRRASAEEFRPRADQALAGMEFESRLPIGEVMVTNSLLKIFAY